jgi:hypothetical protein
MDTKTRHAGDFISYPTNRVVGTIADAQSAQAAIEALIRAGVDREDIDVLHGHTYSISRARCGVRQSNSVR